MIDTDHFSASGIKIRCDEIKTLCNRFEDGVEQRRNLLQTCIDVHVSLKQVDD